MSDNDADATISPSDNPAFPHFLQPPSLKEKLDELLTRLKADTTYLDRCISGLTRLPKYFDTVEKANQALCEISRVMASLAALKKINTLHADIIYVVDKLIGEFESQRICLGVMVILLTTQQGVNYILNVDEIIARKTYQERVIADTLQHNYDATEVKGEHFRLPPPPPTLPPPPPPPPPTKFALPIDTMSDLDLLAAQEQVNRAVARRFKNRIRQRDVQTELHQHQ